MIAHELPIHGRCPYRPVWDYYTARIETEAFVRVEDLEAAAEQVRGLELTQEDVAKALCNALPENLRFRLTVEGRHGQNCKTTISLTETNRG